MTKENRTKNKHYRRPIENPEQVRASDEEVEQV